MWRTAAAAHAVLFSANMLPEGESGVDIIEFTIESTVRYAGLLKTALSKDASDTFNRKHQFGLIENEENVIKNQMLQDAEIFLLDEVQKIWVQSSVAIEAVVEVLCNVDVISPSSLIKWLMQSDDGDESGEESQGTLVTNSWRLHEIFIRSFITSKISAFLTEKEAMAGLSFDGDIGNDALMDSHGPEAKLQESLQALAQTLHIACTTSTSIMEKADIGSDVTLTKMHTLRGKLPSRIVAIMECVKDVVLNVQLDALEAFFVSNSYAPVSSAAVDLVICDMKGESLLSSLVTKKTDRQSQSVGDALTREISKFLKGESGIPMI